MKRFLVVLLLIPSLAFGAFTEFYFQSGGSNLNSGSTTNNTAAYTSIHGNWVQSTGVFTPTDGVNPSLTVNVGDWASVYVDGATNTPYVGRVTAVQNATNGTITVPSTNSWGTKPANQTGTCSIKVGGAQLGPNGANKSFWNANNTANLVDTSGNPTRFNLKNDQTYTMTTSLSLVQGSTAIVQGYTTNPGDGGRATIDFGTTAGNLYTYGAGILADVIMTSIATSGSGDLVAQSGQAMMVRVTAKGSRGNGINLATNGVAIECEANDNDKSNTGGAGFSLSQGNCVYRCIASGNTGSNTDGFSCTISINVFLFNNVSFGNGRHGFFLPGNAAAQSVVANNDAYNNGGDGFKFQGTTTTAAIWLENNNALNNRGYGLNSAITTGSINGWLYNTGFGAGTEDNDSGTTNNLSNLFVSGSFNYTSNVTPYTNTSTGNFSLTGTNTKQAFNAGRGAFTETQGSYSGTTGYPDVGAANHNDTCGGTGPCQTSGASSY